MTHSEEQLLDLQHAETLLDVVFGVVIALPLIDLPKQIHELLASPGWNNAASALLLMAALVFTTFYWIESRLFIAEQQRFDAQVGRIKEHHTDGVPLPLITFLLGGLAMIALATATLTFAGTGTYRAYLIANLLFWLADLGGTITLKRLYKPFRESIATAVNHTNMWFRGHIESPYFYYYGVGNAVLFASLLGLDLITQGSSLARFVAALVVLGFTVFRHTAWRSSVYRSYVRKRYSTP